jgi:hypothetical protein
VIPVWNKQIHRGSATIAAGYLNRLHDMIRLTKAGQPPDWTVMIARAARSRLQRLMGIGEGAKLDREASAAGHAVGARICEGIC